MKNTVCADSEIHPTPVPRAALGQAPFGCSPAPEGTGVGVTFLRPGQGEVMAEVESGNLDSSVLLLLLGKTTDEYSFLILSARLFTASASSTGRHQMTFLQPDVATSREISGQPEGQGWILITLTGPQYCDCIDHLSLLSFLWAMTQSCMKDSRATLGIGIGLPLAILFRPSRSLCRIHALSHAQRWRRVSGFGSSKGNV